MKNLKISLILVFSIFVFTACPNGKNKNKLDAMKELKKNNYDFNHIIKFYHKGLNFYLPSYFSQDYNPSYLLNKDGMSLSNFESGIYFSCENYSIKEVEDYKFLFEDSLENLEALHRYYISQRENSLKSVKISIPHKRSNKKQISGIYQIIEGSEKSAYSFASNMIYMIGTFSKSNKTKIDYYVIQLISTKEMSAYLLDDFKQIINGLN